MYICSVGFGSRASALSSARGIGTGLDMRLSKVLWQETETLRRYGCTRAVQRRQQRHSRSRSRRRSTKVTVPYVTYLQEEGKWKVAWNVGASSLTRTEVRTYCLRLVSAAAAALCHHIRSDDVSYVKVVDRLPGPSSRRNTEYVRSRAMSEVALAFLASFENHLRGTTSS